MAYGITSESQLIDYKTIKRGCEDYINALNDYVDCANQLNEAGNTLSPKALSVDGGTLQEPIFELAQEIVTARNEYAAAAEQIYTDAVTIYNQQVEELYSYYQQQEAERQKNANNG